MGLPYYFQKKKRNRLLEKQMKENPDINNEVLTGSISDVTGMLVPEDDEIYSETDLKYEEQGCLIAMLDTIGRTGKIRISKTPFDLGRNSKDINFEDGQMLLLFEDHAWSKVSRYHCQIVYDFASCEYRIRDTHSTNGTFLNSHRLYPDEWKTLHDGDEICLGDCRFIFREKDTDTLPEA